KRLPVWIAGALDDDPAVATSRRPGATFHAHPGIAGAVPGSPSPRLERRTVQQQVTSPNLAGPLRTTPVEVRGIRPRDPVTTERCVLLGSDLTAAALVAVLAGAVWAVALSRATVAVLVF